MENIKFFDVVTAGDYVALAPADKESAEKALLMAAKYIRSGEPLPYNLAEFLADAIEGALNQPERYTPAAKEQDTGQALIIALRLKANNRPPAKIIPLEVYDFVDWQMHKGFDNDGNHVEAVSFNKAAKAAAIRFDISESTAKRYYRSYLKEYQNT